MTHEHPHSDGKTRCRWAGSDALYLAYHDEEWGVPEFDDRALFEKFVLDGFQAGLSWITNLRKRENFRKAFDHFEPAKIARYKPAKLAALMQNEGIIRNRAKIEGSVASAQAYLALQEGDGFSHYLWNFVDGAPIQNTFRGHEQNSRRNAAFAQNLQGSEAARLQILRSDHRLCVHAGGRHGQRPCRALLAARSLRRARRTPGQGPLTWPRRAPGSACSRASGSISSIRHPSIGRTRISPSASPARIAGADIRPGPLPLSVAQHSLFVLQLRRLRSPESKDARADLR